MTHLTKLTFKTVDRSVTRNNGITCAAAINCFKCKLGEMCHVRSLLFVYS